MSFRSRLLKTHPAALVLASFLSVIALGALLLKMPFATRTGYLPWIDSLFTATSAVCVTGLVVVDTGSRFTLFGQGVILGLIQIGGLGVMTISVALFQLIGHSVSFRHRMVMQDLFAHTPREDILTLVKSMVLFTLAAETLGAILLTMHWYGEFSFSSALYTGIFHSVSAFCNAGFSLYADSMMHYHDSLLLNTTLCALIVTGGIGFPVLFDLYTWRSIRKKRRTRLSIQSKTVLLTTLILILSGALLFGFLQRDTLAASQSLKHCLLVPLFQSITCRTAGFNTVDIASLQDATLAAMLFLMFFGASPGSCGGGVKTTTLAILTTFTVARIQRRKRINLFRKSLPSETLSRSVSLVLVSVGLIGLILFMLLVGDSASGHAVTTSRGPFLAYLFETVSAFGTVGLSMGITPELDSWGKFWIISMMIIGRVGVLTFSYIVVGTGTTNGVEYAEENMMVG